MFALSLITTLSLVGTVWLGSFKKNLYALLNPEEQVVDQRQYAAEDSTSPLGLFRDAAASLLSIFDRKEAVNKSFAPQETGSGEARPFPLSEPR